MFVVIFLSSLCGLTLGLLISSIAGSSDKAVGVLPIVLIPQILFSGTVVEIDNMIPLSQNLSGLMVLRWSYSLLKKISMWKNDAAWDNGYLILALFIPIFVVMTLFFQKRKDIRR
jgi:ABC-type multidrug transport system permease subunit